MHQPWLFADPPDTAVITLDRIVQGESPILLVTHYEEDGSWQFLDGEHVFEDDALVVALGELTQFDQSVSELADLPLGWYAWRSAPDHPWRRTSGEPPSVLPTWSVRHVLVRPLERPRLLPNSLS